MSEDLPKYLLDVIRARRSHRELLDKPVPEEMVDKILEAARWAPSSCNMQFLGLIRITDPLIRERLVREGKAHGTTLVAPAVFVVTYEKELSQEYHSNIQSGAAAVQNMMLVATSLGLGCFWAATVGKEKVIRSILGIPPRREILALAMFGWPKDKPLAPRRREIKELVHINKYGRSRDIPLSADPNDWPLEQLLTFQELRLRSGARYIPYLQEEFSGVVKTIKELIPYQPNSWLDFLPGTGAYTEALVKSFPSTRFAIAEIAEQVAKFAIKRTEKDLNFIHYGFNGIEGAYEVVSCLFRLEAYPANRTEHILCDMSKATATEGVAVLGIVNNRSYFWPLYTLKAALKKEFRFPTMTPNMIAPFKPVSPKRVKNMFSKYGFVIKSHRCLFLIPTFEELSSFYSSKKKGWKQRLLQTLEKMCVQIIPSMFYRRFAKIHIFLLKKDG